MIIDDISQATPRQQVVKYLVLITWNRTVEAQLRQQWLTELQALKESKFIRQPQRSKYSHDSTS